MQTFKNAWAEMLVRAEQTIQNKVSFKVWFEDAYPVGLYNNEAVICVKSNTKKEVILMRYRSMIESALSEILGTEIALRIYSWDEIPDNMVTRELERRFSGEEEDQDDSEDEDEDGLSETAAASYLNYTFDNFIVGSTNRFAHAACMAVSGNPANIYNPLFIYGGSGLGKTHLLYAIKNSLEKDGRYKNIVYIKGEEFVNEMIQAIQSGETSDFRNKYRTADVLLVDDIHFLGGKEATQEEFFHTFNTLYESNRQIIMTSDRTPKEIPLLEERLRSRFESGLIADIQSPDYELRLAIIRKKLEPFKSIVFPEEVIVFLAEKLKNNIRQIEGVIKKLVACYSLTGKYPTLQLAQSVLKDILNENEPLYMTVDKVLIETARYHEVSVDDLKSKKRSAKIALARQTAMYILSEITDMSLNDIGNAFGGKDHSTVHHSLKVIDDMTEKNSRLRQTIDDIIKNVKNH